MAKMFSTPMALVKVLTAKSAMIAFNSKWKFQKLGVAVRVPQKTQNLFISRFAAGERQRYVQRFIIEVHSYCFSY